MRLEGGWGLCHERWLVLSQIWVCTHELVLAHNQVRILDGARLILRESLLHIIRRISHGLAELADDCRVKFLLKGYRLSLVHCLRINRLVRVDACINELFDGRL